MRTAALPFQDPFKTVDHSDRATVDFRKLETLWFNTGTLCNLTCRNCYIASSPVNDRLVYLRHAEVVTYLDEILAGGHEVREIGVTGGEPFMNPDIIPILSDCLARGYNLLVLTNAMRPMMRWQDPLLRLFDLYPSRLTFRVSLDHYTKDVFEAERGRNSWQTTLEGVQWLAQTGVTLHIAGRNLMNQSESEVRSGFADLFREIGVQISAEDREKLIIFPEMDDNADVPEITTACWQKLDVDPADMMCASSRMVVKEKGDAAPHIVACTLLPHDRRFDMGMKLEDALAPVRLNHRHCAKFCVLGGGSCSG